jgi:SAM-dependent methyltransferase
MEGRYQANDPVYLANLKQYEEPKEAFKALVSIIGQDHPGQSLSLIDVGCASGAFLYHALRNLQVSRAVGVDISEQHLEQAREFVPGVEWVQDGLPTPAHDFTGQFDVSTCLGTLCIFDDPTPGLAALMGMVRPGGSAYIYDLINDHGIDVRMRYRRADRGDDAWQSGLNVFSKPTYEAAVASIDPGATCEWHDFEMPIALPRGEDPMRAWTMRTEKREHQLLVGTGQLLNFKILRVKRG